MTNTVLQVILSLGMPETQNQREMVGSIILVWWKTSLKQRPTFQRESPFLRETTPILSRRLPHLALVVVVGAGSMAHRNGLVVTMGQDATFVPIHSRDCSLDVLLDHNKYLHGHVA